MKKRTRAGKEQENKGNVENQSFSIFNNQANNGQKKPERKRRTGPWISKAKRNEILRSLKNGEEKQIL